MLAVERLTYSIPEAARALGISKSSAYKMANEGILPLVKIGNRLLVPRAALEQWLTEAVVNVPKQGAK